MSITSFPFQGGFDNKSVSVKTMVHELLCFIGLREVVNTSEGMPYASMLLMLTCCC